MAKLTVNKRRNMGAFPYPTPPTGLFEKLITGAAADKFLYGVDVMNHGYRQNHEERVGFRRTPTEAMYESYPARPGLFETITNNNLRIRKENDNENIRN